MIQRTLSKTERRMMLSLSDQGARLERELYEVGEAQRELIEMIRQRHSLPDGQYQVRQNPSGDVVIYQVPEEEDKEEPEEV